MSLSLPKISHILYPITFTSIGLETTFRPFTVAEERILLHIRDSKDTKFIQANIKTLIKNCISDDVDVDKLATYDIENFMIKVRAKSVGEVVDVNYTDPETKAKHKGKLNLEVTEVVIDPLHVPKIEIDEKVGLIMKDPDFATILAISSGTTPDADAIWQLIVKCVDQIYDENTVWVVGKDVTVDETQKFIDKLPHTISKQLMTYMNTLPRLEAKILLDDGRTVAVSGLLNFLT